MKEIRVHGRGGQGAVTLAELTALAAIKEGKYAQSLPSFGPERRGAPVQAFVRVSEDKPIKIRTEIHEPDVVVVLDPSLLQVMDVTSGLKDGGIIVINTDNTPEEMSNKLNSSKWRVSTVDATKIARETLGIPVANTTMLGAMVKLTGVVNLDSLVEPLKKRFGRMAEKNINTMKRAYDEVKAAGDQNIRGNGNAII